jgi:hypothetical protein
MSRLLQLPVQIPRQFGIQRHVLRSGNFTTKRSGRDAGPPTTPGLLLLGRMLEQASVLAPSTVRRRAVDRDACAEHPNGLKIGKETTHDLLS